jgi:hypothetical protein
MSVRDRSLPKTGLIDCIEFYAISKNLQDNASFRVWIGKLFQYDKGLTIRFMKDQQHRFTNPENRAIYNDLLALNGLERFAI